MGLLTLYSGLLLPWLGGTFWLVFADARFNKNSQVNRFRQTGYGFFLGYAILFLAFITSNALTGVVSWSYLMVFFLLFSISGAIAAWLTPKQPGLSSPTPKATPAVLAKVLVVFAMVLMAIHLVFIAVEIFTQPLYPWDAWLVWCYRAKAWFLAGGITDIVSTTDWATATSANIYSMDAWTYPLFPSVIPYWAALSLGRWSETLINLPVLFAGLAMGMAMYGQCREHGLGVPASLMACYLFFSIPLLGTHLALAGYADIWMAGFTGLGFVALMRGVIMRKDAAKPNLQLVLGLFMIIFGIWVKNEGAIWFLAALAMLILVSCRPRVPILMMMTVAIVTLLALAFGFTYIEIPLIGKFGIIEGRLVIPYFGNFILEAHDIRNVYWDNFINMGTWNLLWVAVAGSLLLSLLPGLRSPRLSLAHHTRRTALSFVLMFMVSQLFIFGFTNQGLWAVTYTAINRLPLHFVPALLFAVIVIVHASLTQNGNAVVTMESQNGDT